MSEKETLIVYVPDEAEIVRSFTKKEWYDFLNARADPEDDLPSFLANLGRWKV